MSVEDERSDRRRVVGLRQHEVVRWRPERDADHAIVVLHDREVGRSLAELRGIAEQRRADTEEQVVLGLAFAEEGSRLDEE